MKAKLIKYTLLSGVTALMLAGCQQGAQQNDVRSSRDNFFEMASDLTLTRPTDYRSWVYVGTPLTPNDMNNGKAAFQEFHNVYIDPMSYAHYQKTGEFRENTILIKELVSVGSKAAVSGNGYFMGDFIGLEATIKSSKYFPDEPGNWAYYSFTNHDTGILADAKKPFPAESCNACHEGNADDDFVFTQYYPVLAAAKGYGAQPPENVPKRVPTKKHASTEPIVEPTEEENPWKATVPTPSYSTSDVPVKLDALFEYLSSKKYREFTYQEKTTHPSAGPHSKYGLPVRVYYNAVISQSIKDGNKEHPKGAAIVKEMYDKDLNLSGWAVTVKTHDKTDSGKGWFWYEVTSPTDPTELAAFGNGVIGCSSCHISGLDLIKSDVGFIK